MALFDFQFDVFLIAARILDTYALILPNNLQKDVK